MADILLVAATTKEAGFLTSNIKKIVTGKRITVSESSKHKIDLLITGPGMVATTYHVAKALTAQNYQLAVNIGLCGSSIAEIKPGAVVNVTRDTFAGFGAEDGQAFIDIFDLGLMNVNDSPFQNKYLCSNFKQPTNSVKELRKVTGITVQKVTGSNASRKTLLKNYGPVTESMEGSAFFLCLFDGEDKMYSGKGRV